jgi:hypothetical protein
LLRKSAVTHWVKNNSSVLNLILFHIVETPRYSAEMAKQSVVVGLPIVPFNRAKHSDVCQYLDYIEDLLAKIFGNDEYSACLPSEKVAKKNDITKEVKVPLCGDLLGRERVTGAKKTRMGCDNQCERFENIIENVAQWHPKQSFLAVGCYNIKWYCYIQ